MCLGAGERARLRDRESVLIKTQNWGEQAEQGGGKSGGTEPRNWGMRDQESMRMGESTVQHIAKQNTDVGTFGRGLEGIDTMFPMNNLLCCQCVCDGGI